MSSDALVFIAPACTSPASDRRAQMRSRPSPLRVRSAVLDRLHREPSGARSSSVQVSSAAHRAPARSPRGSPHHAPHRLLGRRLRRHNRRLGREPMPHKLARGLTERRTCMHARGHHHACAIMRRRDASKVPEASSSRATGPLDRRRARHAISKSAPMRTCTVRGDEVPEDFVRNQAARFDTRERPLLHVDRLLTGRSRALSRASTTPRTVMPRNAAARSICAASSCGSISRGASEAFASCARQPPPLHGRLRTQPKRTRS